MKLILAAALASLPFAIPATASAQVNCANQPHAGVYEIVGPTCPTANAVVRATVAAEQHGKLYGRTSYDLTAAGGHWRLTWHFRNASGTIPGTHTGYSQIEFYKATSGRQLVAFHTYGSN